MGRNNAAYIIVYAKIKELFMTDMIEKNGSKPQIQDLRIVESGV